MGTSPLQGTHTFSANIFYVDLTVGSTYILYSTYSAGWKKALWDFSVFPRNQHNDSTSTRTYTTWSRVCWVNHWDTSSLTKPTLTKINCTIQIVVDDKCFIIQTAVRCTSIWHFFILTEKNFEGGCIKQTLCSWCHNLFFTIFYYEPLVNKYQNWKEHNKILTSSRKKCFTYLHVINKNRMHLSDALFFKLMN